MPSFHAHYACTAMLCPSTRLPDVQGRFRSPRRPVKRKLCGARATHCLAVWHVRTSWYTVARMPWPRSRGEWTWCCSRVSPPCQGMMHMMHRGRKNPGTLGCPVPESAWAQTIWLCILRVKANLNQMWQADTRGRKVARQSWFSGLKPKPCTGRCTCAQQDSQLRNFKRIIYALPPSLPLPLSYLRHALFCQCLLEGLLVKDPCFPREGGIWCMWTAPAINTRSCLSEMGAKWTRKYFHPKSVSHFVIHVISVHRRTVTKSPLKGHSPDSLPQRSVCPDGLSSTSSHQVWSRLSREMVGEKLPC